MLRPVLHRAAVPRARRLLRPRSYHQSPAHSYNQGHIHVPGHGYRPHPQLRKLGPIVFCLSFVTTVYLAAAAYDVYRDARDTKNRNTRMRAFNNNASKPLTYTDILAARKARRASSQHNDPSSTSPLNPIPTLTADPVNIFIATELGLFGGSYVAPQVAAALQHFPARRTNWTLATTSFGNIGGPLSAAVNTLALYLIGRQALYSPVFDADGAAFTAFYLSTATASSTFSHLVSNVAQPRLQITVPKMYMPLGGGAPITALLAATLMQAPEQQVSVLGLECRARDILTALLALDLYVVLVGFKHGSMFGGPSSLAGLGLGVAYTHFNGKERIWERSRRVTFRAMQMVGVI